MGKFTPMSDALYDYYTRTMVYEEDSVLTSLREATAKRDDAGMQVSAEQGQLMTLLTSLVSTDGSTYGAIEVGMFTGYSAISIARGLQGRKLLACDVNPETAAVAKEHFSKAGLSDVIDVRIGPALDTLQQLRSDGVCDVDIVFIDADKVNYGRYFETAIELVRTGGLICVDNVFWGGAVADSSQDDPDTAAIRELNGSMLSDDRVRVSTIPIADGLTVAQKL